MSDAFIALIYLTSKMGKSQRRNESCMVINNLQYCMGESQLPHTTGVSRFTTLSCTKKDTFKSKFLRREKKDQIGKENKGSLKLAFILNIFCCSSTIQCNAVFLPLFSPSFCFAVSLIALYMSVLPTISTMHIPLTNTTIPLSWA